MNADTLTEALLLTIRPVFEQAIAERIGVLIKKLKLDEKKVWAALCEGTPAEAKGKLPKTTTKIVDGKPSLAAPVTGAVQKLVLVHNYSDKSFAVTSLVPSDTKNIKDHLKAMDLKYNGNAKIGTPIWVGQSAKLAGVEAKLKELGLKYRKLAYADYEKEVVKSKSSTSVVEEADEAENAEEPTDEVPVDENVEAEPESGSEEESPKLPVKGKGVATAKSKVATAKGGKSPSPAKSKAGAAKAVLLQAKKNKWGNNAHEGYIFEKLPLGSNGAKIDAVIGVQDTKAPATKKEYASILPLSDDDREKCEANGWRAIDEESLLIIKKKDAKKYEVLAKVLKGKEAASPKKVFVKKLIKVKPPVVEEEEDVVDETD